MAQPPKLTPEHLRRWGHIVPISVVPEVFGKNPDRACTTWAVRMWCHENLTYEWDVDAIRVLIWTMNCAYFNVVCINKQDSEKVNAFFNHPKV